MMYSKYSMQKAYNVIDAIAEEFNNENVPYSKDNDDICEEHLSI